MKYTKCVRCGRELGYQAPQLTFRLTFQRSDGETPLRKYILCRQCAAAFYSFMLFAQEADQANNPEGETP